MVVGLPHPPPPNHLSLAHAMGAISKGSSNKKSGMAVLCPKRTTGVANPWGVMDGVAGIT